MSITDNRKIVIKVCKHFFEEGLSQKEISAKLTISRPQISRILNYAKAKKIVTISIDNPYEKESELEELITSKFDLSDTVVMKSVGITGDISFEKFVQITAAQLEAYIPNGSTVGVMSGRTLSAVINEVSHLDRRNLTIVPLVGGDGSNGTDWHANVIARSLAKKTGGKYFLLNAPVVVENPKVAKVLKAEPSIAEIINLGAKCDVSIIGVGNMDLDSTSGKASHLTLEEINELKELGAVATSCVSYINRKGEIVDTMISDRLIGQPLSNLRKSKVIVIAMGKSKVEALKAVLRTGYIDVLFTNLETAIGIVNDN